LKNEDTDRRSRQRVGWFQQKPFSREFGKKERVIFTGEWVGKKESDALCLTVKTATQNLNSKCKEERNEKG
jgi:hypothetical protein